MNITYLSTDLCTQYSTVLHGHWDVTCVISEHRCQWLHTEEYIKRKSEHSELWTDGSMFSEAGLSTNF